MFTFEPILVLAGNVAGVVANLEHAHNNNFDLNRLNRALGERTRGHRGEQQAKNEAH